MTDDFVCKDGFFHDYSHVRGEDDQILVEECVYCSRVIRFPKSERGRIDNARYALTHELWFMQPTHRLYGKCYGRAKAIPLHGKAKVEECKREMAEIVREERRFAKRKYFT